MAKYSRCWLMHPLDDFDEPVRVASHGDPNDPRELVHVWIDGEVKARNMFDVVFVDKRGEEVDNPWLCPGTTMTEVCRVTGLDRYRQYKSKFFVTLAEDGYPEEPRVKINENNFGPAS